jgi:hypothetical protein
MEYQIKGIEKEGITLFISAGPGVIFEDLGRILKTQELLLLVVGKDFGK